jgi:hypothetical protein
MNNQQQQLLDWKKWGEVKLKELDQSAVTVTRPKYITYMDCS